MYETIIATAHKNVLANAYYRAVQKHGWSDNSLSYDLGLELEYLLGDDIYDEDGEVNVDYEALGDDALSRLDHETVVG